MRRDISKRFIKLLLLAVVSCAILSVVQGQDTKTTTYKIAEAGIQMDLPPGWEASKDPNGTILILKKDAGGYVLYSFSVLGRDPALTLDTTYSAFSDGIFENAKKEWKGLKTGDLTKDTQGGMALRAQKLEGNMESAGGDLEGLVVVIDAPQRLGIFAQRTKKHSELLEREGDQLLSSIRKIQ